MTGRRSTVGSERKLAIGQRMKLAAEQAGFSTTVAMGAAMQVPNSTVSRWWRGVQTPTVDELAYYAELTGKRIWWFYVESADAEFDLVAEALREIVGMAMTQGRDLADGFSQVTGETDQFNRRERAVVAAGTPSVRRQVDRATDAPWAELSDGEQRAVIDQLAARALHPPRRPRRS